MSNEAKRKEECLTRPILSAIAIRDYTKSEAPEIQVDANMRVVHLEGVRWFAT